MRKAGGVYYTPEYIVRYIVANTVGKAIEGKTPADIAGMRFADIACGSGSFLIEVFDTLLRYARSAGSPIYFIAVNIPLTDFKSRKAINQIATESGGEVFAIGSASKITEVTHRIEEELRSQYVLAFRTDSQKPPGQYREVRVAVAKPCRSALIL